MQAKCNHKGTMVAHASDDSTCYTGFTHMHYQCVNGTWMLDIDGILIAEIDQIYCMPEPDIGNYCLDSTVRGARDCEANHDNENTTRKGM